jgi:hypothetical protein
MAMGLEAWLRGKKNGRKVVWDRGYLFLRNTEEDT